MSRAKAKLKELIDFVLDGSCTDDQRVEFAKLIDESLELTPELVQQVFVHSLLEWQIGESDGFLDGLSLSEILPASVKTESETRSGRGHRSRLRISPPSWFWATAALLLVSALTSWLMLLGEGNNRVAVAQITDQHGVKWTDASYQVGETRREVYPGRLQTESGGFTIQFRSGPVVQVSGPTSMMIESDMLIHLDRGQATARVPEQAIGFAIKTPVIDVIDQGTEFGVSASSNGQTDVVVFDGKVDLADGISDQGVSRSLKRGEAVRVDRHGNIKRIMEICRNVEGRWSSGDGPNASRNLIARVTDNIGGSSEVYSYYQTTYRGLQDDALAYSDNPNHQWNGLTPDGLPEFLRGADYIRTFNGYRYLMNFEVTIELSQPANLYIMADNRIPPPDWLVDEFEDTGVDIGLDEGPWDYVEPEYRKYNVNTTAVGAGNSIDNVFSVWRRRCTDGKPIVLGSAGELGGEGQQGRAMYGLAATPLDITETP